MNLRKIIQEEVAKINEAMMTKKFMKATEELQKVQLRRQELKKKFVAETEPSLKEKLKQQLIKIHKEVQKAEAKFNSAIMSEPIDLDEKYTEAVIEEGKKDYKELPGKVNEDYSQRARNFRVALRRRLASMKKGKKIKYGKLTWTALGNGNFKDSKGRTVPGEDIVLDLKFAVKGDILQHRGAAGDGMVDAYLKFEGKLNEASFAGDVSSMRKGLRVFKIDSPKTYKILDRKFKLTKILNDLNKLQDYMDDVEDGKIKLGESKLNEMPKGAAKGKGGTTPAPINRWWENDKRQLMSIVYHSQRQLPPSDKGVYNREYINIVNQLQKKFPAPPEIIKIKLKEATVDKSVSERIKSLTPEQKSRLKEKLISKYKK